MAEVLPLKDRDIIHAESLAMAATAETLATAGATIPQNTGEVVVVCPTGKSLHWLASVTPPPRWATASLTATPAAYQRTWSSAPTSSLMTLGT